MCIRDRSCSSRRRRSCRCTSSGPSTRSRTWRSPVSYTHLRAHETPEHLVCRLLLEKKKGHNYLMKFIIFSIYYIVFNIYYFFFFLMIRRPPRSTLDRSSAASDVYKRQGRRGHAPGGAAGAGCRAARRAVLQGLSLIHISEPTRLLSISYAVFCLKKK